MSMVTQIKQKVKLVALIQTYMEVLCTIQKVISNYYMYLSKVPYTVGMGIEYNHKLHYYASADHFHVKIQHTKLRELVKNINCICTSLHRQFKT